MFLSSRLQPLRSGGRESCLTFVPQTLTTVEIVQIIFLFILRQIFHLVGLGNDASRTIRDNTSLAIPEIHLSMPFRLTKDGLRQYAMAAGLDHISAVLDNPPQTCLLLSAFSEPAMLLLLAFRNCPILPLGAVNVRNRFEILMPRLCTEEALLNMDKAELRARTMGETRKVKRGLEIDLEVVVVNFDEDVVIFRQVFTMLQFMKFKPSNSAPSTSTINQDIKIDWSKAPAASFNMDLDDPLKWASICKDYNVLHISTLAARLFGFSGRIAHGNHALAMGIARSSGGQDALKLSPSEYNQSTSMEVQFRKPMTLPATFSVQKFEQHHAGFRISKNDQTCVVASMQVMSQG